MMHAQHVEPTQRCAPTQQRKQGHTTTRPQDHRRGRLPTRTLRPQGAWTQGPQEAQVAHADHNGEQQVPVPREVVSSSNCTQYTLLLHIITHRKRRLSTRTSRPSSSSEISSTVSCWENTVRVEWGDRLRGLYSTVPCWEQPVSKAEGQPFFLLARRVQKSKPSRVAVSPCSPPGSKCCACPQ